MSISHPGDEPRLRIMIGAETFFPDVNGAATFARQLAQGLARLGHDVHVVAPSPTSKPTTTTLDDFTLHYVRSLRAPYHASMHWNGPWQNGHAMRQLIAQVKPDIVHLQSAFFIGSHLAAAAIHADIPVIGTNHVIPENLVGYRPVPEPVKKAFSDWVWWQLRRVYNRCDVVTAPTQRAVDLLYRCGLEQEAYPISCGIDLSRPLADSAVPRPDTDTPEVLFIGRLDEEKRICDLIEALSQVPASTGLHATIIGTGNQRDALETQARELGVKDRVAFLGFVSDEDLRLAYQGADIFCMPSIAELQSLVTLEAVASRLPVVAADALALPHLVHDGVNGFLADVGDVATYADRLTRLAKDPALRRRMGEAGALIAQEHDLSRTLQIFTAIYRLVIKRRKQPDGQASGLPAGWFEQLLEETKPTGAIGPADA